MNNRLDWSDYEIVLRIADTGSLSRAAKMSGLSHPTLFRRINAVEEKLGVRLFDRFRTGYQPTAAGEEVVSTARRIAELVNETERLISGRDLRPSGSVRVATTDTLLFGLLSPLIARFRQVAPEIRLDIVVSNEISDLSMREADIAIRPASAPDEHLVGRKLGVIRQAVYAHRSHDFGDAIRTPLDTLPWVGPSFSMAYAQLHAWMKKNGCDRACVCRMDSVLGMCAAVRSGVGVAVLPAYLAASDTELLCLGDTVDDLSVDLWILTHPDLRRTARVRAVLDFFAELGTIP
ncbi:MAG: LysR family transcriptional regulator [Phyllobacteriaceae bacterium]|nr:LysR family transcriptional regulator [Phyllobacteriaceae bacterium]MBA92333.1 LysR family transcriptional regulator [Phyllobacteriaceae bacterium]